MRRPLLAAILVPLAACAASPSAELARILEAEQEGPPGVQDEPFEDPSREAEAARASHHRALLAKLEALDPAGLGEEERLTRAVLARELRDRVADFEHAAWRQPLTSDSGFHVELARLPSRTRIEDEEDVREYLEKLRAMPAHVEAYLANLRRGLEDGVSLPRVILDGYDAPMAAQVVETPEESVFYEPVGDYTDSEELLAEARTAVMEGPVATYRRLLDFWREEYLPRARTSVGLSAVPGGRAWYEHLVRRFTTLDLTPEEVHELGLEEVARIRADMERTMEDAGFEGDFAAFLDHLRTDPRFYAETPEQLLAHASRLAKRADGALPRFFGLLPRIPYGVEPVPADIAPRYTGGRYIPPSPGESGTYWVNTYDLPSRPLYVLPALTLHEAVPGHHLQIALARELEDLPKFRRELYVNAYGEGWALYCEWLGIEMGLYDDPYDAFGRQTYEMWRACRLVVDTGLHAFGWSRERSVDYLASNTALSLHECRTEVDRYISWPGQALSYKIGELEIRRLRAEAERRLGEDFDLRAFHDEVLGHGALPLDVLGEVIEGWIAEREGG